MKKVLFLIAATILTANAFDKSDWSSGYQIKTVRMNGNNWFGFNVVTKNTTNSGNLVTDEGMWFGILPTDPRYNTVVSMVLTAKATGRTIAFCPCNRGTIAGTNGIVWDISAGVDVE
jgi:hypothetical protein